MNKKIVIPLLIIIAAAIVIISVVVAMNSGANNAPENKPAETTEQTTDENNKVEAEQPEATEDCYNELSEVLDDIVATAAPGTAGGSLKAAIGASELLDFIYNKGYSTEALTAAAEKYASGMSNSAEKAEQFTDVASAVTSLQGEYAQDLLDDAGVTGSSYPWDDDTMNKAFSVLTTLGAEGI